VQPPTAPQFETRFAIYPEAEFMLPGSGYSNISPGLSGQCGWTVEGEAIATAWSRPDCQTIWNINPWVEYTAWLTAGTWKIGLNAINTGAGLGEDPTWYPEFLVGQSLTDDIIVIPASDTEVNHGYFEYKVPSAGLYTVRFWWLNDKCDHELELDANIKITSVFFDKAQGSEFSGFVHRPYQWSVHDLPWPGGLGDRQLQSVLPLDAQGDLVLVGGQGDESNYVVFDFSSGNPVVVASIGNLGGYKTALHSPNNSSVVYAGGGNVLVKYDGGFDLIPLPCANDDNCSMNGIWARSETDVWITRSRSHPIDVDQSLYYDEIWHWTGDGFSLEYESFAGDVSHFHLWGIWATPSGNEMFAVGDRILHRNDEGVWSEMLHWNDLPGTCDGYLFSVQGVSAKDVWVSDFWGKCLLHYDGASWSDVTSHAASPNTIQLLGGKQMLWAGQGRTDGMVGRISIWGSVDGGLSWNQLQSPVFSQVPMGGSQGGFFDLAMTTGGTRVFAPTIRGGRLVIGSLTPMASHIEVSAMSLLAESVNIEESVLLEPEQ